MDYIKLSKTMSYALRHKPWEFELELDDDGWVDINQLLSSLQEENRWMFVQKKDILHVYMLH